VPAATGGSTFVNGPAGRSEGLLQKAAQRSWRLARGSLTDAQRLVAASLQIARNPRRNQGNQEDENAEHDDCTYQHAVWLPVSGRNEPSMEPQVVFPVRSSIRFAT